MSIDIHELRQAIASDHNPLIERVSQARRVLLEVASADDLNLVGLGEYAQEEDDYLHLSEHGINGIPWEIIDATPERMHELWSAAYYVLSVDYLRAHESYLRSMVRSMKEDGTDAATLEETEDRLESVGLMLNEESTKAARYTALTGGFTL